MVQPPRPTPMKPMPKPLQRMDAQARARARAQRITALLQNPKPVRQQTEAQRPQSVSEIRSVSAASSSASTSNRSAYTNTSRKAPSDDTVISARFSLSDDSNSNSVSRSGIYDFRLKRERSAKANVSRHRLQHSRPRRRRGGLGGVATARRGRTHNPPLLGRRGLRFDHRLYLRGALQSDAGAAAKNAAANGDSVAADGSTAENVEGAEAKGAEEESLRVVLMTHSLCDAAERTARKELAPHM